MKKHNSLNINIVLKIILLFGFAAFFLSTVLSGSVSLYVHPRIVPYMIFASAAMIIIAVLLFRDLFKDEKKKANSWPMLFFIIPLVMAFSLPAQSMDTSNSAIGEVRLSGSEDLSYDAADDTSEPEETSSPAPDTSAEDENEADESQSQTSSALVMNSSNFYSLLCDVYENIDKFQGVQIEVEGFVFRGNGSLTDDEFIPARLMMVCCAADMQPVGLLCRYDKALELETDSWVKVFGTIGEADYEGETIPCIIAQSVETVEEPDKSYIYPY
ncbi:MAG: TIGR03943 family protein [Clostridia bacterium]|nr:TIGR03943 family protein [Clostridia bacterium]